MLTQVYLQKDKTGCPTAILLFKRFHLCVQAHRNESGESGIRERGITGRAIGTWRGQGGGWAGGGS